jgi:hypothetical protein
MIFEPKDLRNVAKWSSVVWEVHYITGSETPLDKDVIVGRLVLRIPVLECHLKLECGRPTDNLQEQREEIGPAGHPGNVKVECEGGRTTWLLESFLQRHRN